MKKILLVLLLILSCNIFSQEFRLTENNFVNKSESSIDYIVLEFSGKNKDQLFTLAKNYIESQKYNFEKTDYSEKLNENITFILTSQTGRTIFIDKKKKPNVWKVVNRFEINFKDNKIMIRPFFLHLLNADTKLTTSLGSFFNSRGILRYDHAASFVESFANTFVRDLKKGIEENKSNDW
ncbi:hypothetical protein [Chryseobacterium balustinum]|uniref:hypothetical protein n=1 Tax=Chryseobacterium balustinum TaxID=246 RepID=UPI003CF04E3E